MTSLLPFAGHITDEKTVSRKFWIMPLLVIMRPSRSHNATVGLLHMPSLGPRINLRRLI